MKWTEKFEIIPVNFPVQKESPVTCCRQNAAVCSYYIHKEKYSHAVNSTKFQQPSETKFGPEFQYLFIIQHKELLTCKREKRYKIQNMPTDVLTLKLIGFSEIAATIASSPSKTSAGPGERCCFFISAFAVD